jgi:hypothetical protein
LVIQELTNDDVIKSGIVRVQSMQPPAEHQTPRCPNCLTQVVIGSTGCAACGREFGAPLLAGENANPDPELLRRHRWTWISLGRDPLARTAGKTLAAGWIFFVVYSLFASAFSDAQGKLVISLVMALTGFFSADVIHGFTHGRSIYVLRMGYFDATPVNTGVRTFGLAIQLVMMAFFTWMVLR